MKRYLIILLVMLTCGSAWARRERDTLGVGTFVSFTENLGQWDSRVRYEAQLHDAAIFLEDNGMTIALRDPIPHPALSANAIHTTFYRMRFAGSGAPSISTTDQQKSVTNYYIGDDPARWRSGVASYGSVRYNGLYDGIDLEIYSANRALKYNFIVSAGADASQLAIDYIGTRGVSVGADGNLRIRTSVRDIIELRPYVYQTLDGKEREVKSRWSVERLEDRYRVSIRLGDYDNTEELVIDPVLIFSTYTGSTADNWGTTAAYDGSRNVYTAGLVFAMGYPTSSAAYDSTFNGNCDVGIFAFDPTGQQRLWATYLGGNYADMPHSMFVNQKDELLIFGTTGSDDFPTDANAYMSTFRGGPSINYEFNTVTFPNGSDIFVSRFNTAGQLDASTYIGGTDNDGLNYRDYFNNNLYTVMFGNDSLYHNYGDGARGEIITDDLGNVYVGSTTASMDFPTTEGCVQRTSGSHQEGVVFKLDYNLRSLVWSTYLGGYGDDAVYSIDVDSAYNLLVCGGTTSHNFPTTGRALQTTYGGGSADGFVSKISYNGRHLMASTYLGSTAYDQMYFVRAGRHDEVFLFGQTGASGSTMIHNAGYSVPGSGMLLARLTPDLSDRVWSTVFGTPGRINLSPTAFAADICNRVYAVGWGRDFVGYSGVQWYTLGTTGMETTADAFSDSTDGQDFYIISLDADANQLEYATFFGELHNPDYGTYGGGDHVDGGTSRFDRLATLYQSVCASCGGYNAFPTTANAWSDSNRSTNCNNAIFRFNVTDDFPVADFYHSGSVNCTGQTFNFHSRGRGDTFQWDFGDGTTATGTTVTHAYDSAGIYTVTLIATMTGGCSDADTCRRTVHVIADGGEYHEAPLTACNGDLLQIGPPPIGTAEGTYHWTTEGVSDPDIANPWVSDSGTYILQVTGSGTPACHATYYYHVKTYTLVNRHRVTPPSCHDSADARLTIVLSSGLECDSLNVTLTVDGTARTAVITDSTAVADSLPAGGHVWYLVTGYGCQYEDSLIIENPAPPYYEKQMSTPLCSDSCTGWVRLTNSHSVIHEAETLDTLISDLCPGTHITRIEWQGCPIIDTTEITIDHDLDSLTAWADDTLIYLSTSTLLHVTPIEGANYIWSHAYTLDGATTADPEATPVDTLTEYTVSVTDANGCTAESSVTIHCTEVVCGDPLFVIPNAFTPNGDGMNDRISFNGQFVTDFYIAIFNRWGEKVYESSDVNQSWDGTYRSQPCLPGVYTYTCHITCEAGYENDFKGDITLIR